MTGIEEDRDTRREGSASLEGRAVGYRKEGMEERREMTCETDDSNKCDERLHDISLGTRPPSLPPLSISQGKEVQYD